MHYVRDSTSLYVCKICNTLIQHKQATFMVHDCAVSKLTIHIIQHFTLGYMYMYHEAVCKLAIQFDVHVNACKSEVV